MSRVYDPVSKTEFDTRTGPRRGVQAVYQVLCWHYHKAGIRGWGIYSWRNVGSVGRPNWKKASLHAVGRAMDLGVTNKAAGDQVYLKLLDNAHLVGVIEVIWQKKRATWNARGQLIVADYNGPSPHTDHLHVGFSVDWADNASDFDDLKAWATAALT